MHTTVKNLSTPFPIKLKINYLLKISFGKIRFLLDLQFIELNLLDSSKISMDSFCFLPWKIALSRWCPMSLGKPFKILDKIHVNFEKYKEIVENVYFPHDFW